jgi:hypothetical protein
LDPPQVSVIDADGHPVESIAGMIQSMDPSIRGAVLSANRNLRGVFQTKGSNEWMVR